MSGPSENPAKSQAARRAHFDQRNKITAFAELTYNRLPRELRDEVYKHLWKSHNYTDCDHPSNQRDQERPYVDIKGRALHKFLLKLDENFISGHYVGQDFVREVVGWFFQHGCTNRYVAVTDLSRFLTTQYFSAQITPARSNMRSLNVEIYAPGFEDKSSLERRQELYFIEKQFDALLSLGLIKGFKLGIVVTIGFHHPSVDAHRLPVICAQVKRVMQKFEARSCHVTINFDLARHVYTPNPMSGMNSHPHLVPSMISRSSQVIWFAWDKLGPRDLMPCEDVSTFSVYVNNRVDKPMDMLDARGLEWTVFLMKSNLFSTGDNGVLYSKCVFFSPLGRGMNCSSRRA